MRYITMRTVAIRPFEWPACCKPCEPHVCFEGPLSTQLLDTTIVFMAVYMYPVEVFGVMPKEAKDCINALIKVADEDKLGVDLVLLVPDIPPAPPKTFWERLREKMLTICCGRESKK